MSEATTDQIRQKIQSTTEDALAVLGECVKFHSLPWMLREAGRMALENIKLLKVAEQCLMTGEKDEPY